MKATRSGQEKTQEEVHRVRITLSSKNAKNLEKVCAELLSGAKNKRQKVEGDEEIPAKVLPISSSPYGNGVYNSLVQHMRPSKKGITNFRWSPSMSRFLLPFLVEQVKLGQKVNKTFRRQAFIEAARAVNEKYNLKCTDSNVENHMRTIKTRYQQIRKLLGMSNTSWDEKEKKIIMDAASYGEHIMAHPRDEPFINKSIDMYDEMVILCGDDYPIGNSVDGTADNFEELPATASDEVNIVMDEDVEIEEAREETQSRSRQVSTSSGSTGRIGQSGKRSRHLADKIDYLALQIGELAEAIRSSRRGISAELFTEIMKCEGYDEATLGKAFDYLHEHENLARAFLAKNQNLRQVWLSDFFSDSGQMS